MIFKRNFKFMILKYLICWFAVRVVSGTYLVDVTDQLAIISRVVSAITVQNELVGQNRSVEEVTESFLGAKSVSSINNLSVSGIDVRQVERYAVGTPDLSLRLDDVTNGIGILEIFKEKMSIFKINRAREIEGMFLEAAKTSFQTLNIGSLISLKELLESFETISSGEGGGLVEQLKSSIPAAMAVLTSMRSFRSDFGHFIALQSATEDLQNLKSVPKIVQDYRKQFNVLSLLGTALESVKLGVSGLAETVKQHEKLRELGNRLEAVAGVFGSATGPPTSRTLTVGLPNGVVDLKTLLEKDLKGDWLRKQIADGKDVGKLEKALGPLRKYMTSLEQLTVSWQKVREPQTIRLIQQLAEDFTKAADEGRLSEGGDVTRQLEDVSSCFKHDLSDANITDEQIADVEKLFEEALNLIEVSALFESNVTVFQPTCELMIKEIKYIGNNLNKKEDENAVFIKSLTNRGVLVSNLSAAVENFRFFTTINTDLVKSWGIGRFEAILNILADTNLNKVLDCLTGVIYDPTKIQKTLQFGSVMQSIRNRTTEIGAVEAFLKSASVVQSHLKKVVGVVGDATKQSRMRRDDNLDAKELLKLDDARKVSLTLGKAVEALRRMEEVRENRVTVTKIARSESTVDAEIAKTSVYFWTPENKERLLGLVKKVEALETEAAKYKGKGFVEIGDVFDSAALIECVSIDSKLLEDPVSTTLRASNDPQIQAYADDFRNVARLQLDYSTFYVPLREATGSLGSLQSFFDTFFGIHRPVSSSNQFQSATQASTKETVTGEHLKIIVYVAIVLIVVAFLILVYCILKRRDPLVFKRLFLSDEKLRRAIRLQSRHLAFQEVRFEVKDYKDLTQAVVACDASSAAKFLRMGAYVNAQKAGDSLLHLAVRNGDAKMARLLIRAGANRSFFDNYYETPEESLKTLKSDEESVEKKRRFGEVQHVFGALRQKTFYGFVPTLLPTSSFRIFIADNVEKKKEFKESFEFCVTGDVTAATHIVAKVNEHGVYIVDPKKIQAFDIIFRPALLMQSQWLTACLENRRNLRKDNEWRVEKVKMAGKEYGSVVEWNESFFKKDVSFLHEFHCLFVHNWPLNLRKEKLKPRIADEPRQDETMKSLLNRLGSTLHSDSSTMAEHSDLHTYPYHHFEHRRLVSVSVKPRAVIAINSFGEFDIKKYGTRKLSKLLLERKCTYDPMKKPRLYTPKKISAEK